MESTVQSSPAPTLQGTPAPATTSPAVVRRLAVGVMLANGAVAIIAAIVIAAMHRADWWPAFVAAAVVAMIGAAVSILILSKAAGRTVDWLVTIVMGTAGARMFVSLFGLLIAIKGLHTPDEATALMICSFYAVTLIVETALLTRAVATPGKAVVSGAVGGTHA